MLLWVCFVYTHVYVCKHVYKYICLSCRVIGCVCVLVYDVYVFVCLFVFDVSVCGCNCGI